MILVDAIYINNSGGSIIEKKICSKKIKSQNKQNG